MASQYFMGTAHAAAYIKYRSTPPKSLINTIIKFLGDKVPPNSEGKWDYAVDVGCGSGQSTYLIGEYFDSISGLDVSKAQLKEAKKHNSLPNITYSVGSAESMDFLSSSVDLVTSSTAAHWFDMPKFFKEVDRILVPGGVVALFCYNCFRCKDHPSSAAIDALTDEIFNIKIGGFWGEEKKYADDKYRDPLFLPPFEERVRDESHSKQEYFSVSDCAGYISSMSAFSEYCKKHGQEKGEQILQYYVNGIMDVLDVSTTPEETQLKVAHPYFLIMGRKPLL